MKKLEWTTVQRRVNDLVPLEINPRKISEAKRMKMIESLQRFGLVDMAAFRTAFRTEGSPVWKAYRKGQDIASFAIDSKLFEMAKNGDMKALATLGERQRLRNLKK